MRPKLYSLELSHPANAVRAMLELKGVDHEVVNLLPGLHPLFVRAAGFRGPTVPALRVDGGRFQGSVRISRFLDHYQPEPRLFPEDPDAKRAVEQAEAWGEATLQPVPRRLMRWATVRQPGLRRWLAEMSGMPLPGVAGFVNAPVARRFARAVGATDERIRADLAELPATLDRVDALIADGTIGGEPNAADFQIASSVRALLAFEDLEPRVADRPCAELAMRLFAAYPSPIPWRLPADAPPAD
ncbi:MAG: glutathione S-transferase family protein [Solirubrobacterales bacterium]